MQESVSEVAVVEVEETIETQETFESKYSVAPTRNQFGMISILDDEGDVAKTVKSITAAATWITSQQEALLQLVHVTGISLEEVKNSTIKELQVDIHNRLHSGKRG